MTSTPQGPQQVAPPRFQFGQAGRSKALDILRAMAVLLVLGAHMTPCPVAVSPFLNSITEVWKRGGWVGVDLFFVLSGFLISGLLFQEHQRMGRISVKRFLIRRGFKIYPAFWLLMVVTVLVGVVRHHPRAPSRLTAELLFIQNYQPGLWAHTWTLAVEEHFYFALAVLLLWLSVRGKGEAAFRPIRTSCAFLAVTCLALRLLTWQLRPDFHELQFNGSHLRVDSLFFGVLLSYYYHHQSDRFLSLVRHYRVLLVSTGIVLLAPAFISQLATKPFVSTVGLTLFYLGSGCLLMGFLGISMPERGLAARVAYVGSHSYSLYLWHVPLLAWGIPLLARLLQGHWNWYVYSASYVLGALGLGITMAKLIEFPVLGLRDRWFPSSGQALSVPVRGTSPAAVVT